MILLGSLDLKKGPRGKYPNNGSYQKLVTDMSHMNLTWSGTVDCFETGLDHP